MSFIVYWNNWLAKQSKIVFLFVIQFHQQSDSANSLEYSNIRECHHLTIRTRIVFLNYSRKHEWRMANTSFRLLVFCFKFLPTADMAAASFDQKAKSCLDCVLGQPRELHFLFFIRTMFFRLSLGKEIEITTDN